MLSFLSWLVGRATIFSGSKPAVAAASKQQRLLAVVGVGLDRTEKNHVVAAVVSIGGAALEICDAVGKKRRVAEARRPFDACKFVFRRFRKFASERLLRCTKHIDHEMVGVLEHAQARRIEPQAPEHQWRIE